MSRSTASEIQSLMYGLSAKYKQFETPDVEEGSVHIICESFEEKRNRYQKLSALQRWYLIGASLVIAALLFTAVVVAAIYLYQPAYVMHPI